MEKHNGNGVGGETGHSAPAPSPEEVRGHLDFLLKSPHFSHSKRSQTFLAFVVEEALKGHGDQLKERTIGVHALGREPTYDTNQDAVVRNAANEVRKRLAQFYLDSGHESRVRIDLPPGSYLPEFRLNGAPQNPADPPASAVASPTPHRWRNRILVALAILALGGGALLTLQRILPTASDRFWSPVLDGGAVVQVCLGQPAELYSFRGARKAELDRAFNVRPAQQAQEAKEAVSTSDVAPVAGRYLWRRDAFCMADLAAMLASRGKRFRLRSESDAPFLELQGSPLIMVGGFDWRGQIRLGTRRFGFGQDRIDGTDYRYVRDRQNLNDRSWKVPASYTQQEASNYDDYGIVTRD